MRLRTALQCCVALLCAAAAPRCTHADLVIPNDLPTVNYSTANVSEQAGYTASSAYDAQGMEHLYTLTNYFISLVLSKGVPEFLVSKKFVEDPSSYVLEHKWELFREYKFLAILVLLGVLLAVLVPLVGFAVCCCRCFGKCGGAEEVPEKSKDEWVRGILGLLVFLIVVSMLFAIVCAFVTNEYVVAGTRGLPARLETSLHDFKLYINNTQTQVEQLLVKDYAQLARRIDEELDRTGDRLRSQFAKSTKAFAADNLLGVVERLDNITQLLQQIQTTATDLQHDSADLTTRMKNMEGDLQSIASQCQLSQCKSMLNSKGYQQLHSATAIQLPTNDIQQLESKLQKLTANKIADKIRQGVQSFSSVNTTFQNEVKSVVQEIHGKVASIGEKLKNATKDYQYNVNTSSANTVVEQIHQWVRRAEPYLPYYRYAGIGMGCVVTAVFLLYTLGVTWGACGGHGGSCNFSTGATLFAWGIGIFCSTYLLLQLPVTAMFLAGSLAERSACDVARVPEGEAAQRLLQLGAGEFEYNVTLIAFVARTVPKCRTEDWSLYRVIQEAEKEKVLAGNHTLRAVDLDRVQNFRTSQELDKKINELADKIGNTSFNIELLTPEGEKLVKELQQAPFSSIRVADIQEKIKDDPPTYQLSHLSRELKSGATAVRSNHHLSNMLTESANKLDGFVNNDIPKITNNLHALRSKLTMLDMLLVVNGTKIEDAIKRQYDDVVHARDTIRTKGKAMVKDLGRSLVNGLVALVDNYVNHSKVQAESEIGRCKPVSEAYDSAVNSVCMGVVLPFNGFWVSIGWCLIFGIPATVFAAVLTSLYRRGQSLGPLSDSDYISDTAYTERDTIPLAQLQKTKI